MLQKLAEGVHGQARLTDDAAERAFAEFAVLAKAFDVASDRILDVGENLVAAHSLAYAAGKGRAIRDKQSVFVLLDNDIVTITGLTRTQSSITRLPRYFPNPKIYLVDWALVHVLHEVNF